MTTLSAEEKAIINEYLANGGKRQRVKNFHYVPNKDGTYKKEFAGSHIENNVELYARLKNEEINALLAKLETEDDQGRQWYSMAFYDAGSVVDGWHYDNDTYAVVYHTQARASDGGFCWGCSSDVEFYSDKEEDCLEYLKTL